MPCSFSGRNNRVAPQLGAFDGYELVEIRPRRTLRILHLNATKRDEEWIHESEKYTRIRRFFEKAGNIVQNNEEFQDCANSSPTSHKSGLQEKVQKSKVNFAKAKENGAPQNLHDDNPMGNNIDPCIPDANLNYGGGGVPSLIEEELPTDLDDLGDLVNSPSKSSNHSQEVQISPQNTGKHVRLKLDPKPTECSAKVLPGNSVIFFFHGVGGSIDMWQAQLEYFSHLGYEIVAPDLIGHGLSMAPDEPKAYLFKEIMWDLVAIIDRYFRRDNVIIGHSYGSCFATVIARMRPRRVSKLVLISGGGPTPLAPQPGVFSLPVCMLKCIKPCLDCSFRRSAFHPKNRNRVTHQRAFDIPAYVFRYIMRGQDWLDGDAVFHRLLNVATLLVYGLKDELVDLEDEKDMEKCIAGSRLEVVEDASHMVMMECSEKVNDLIRSFLLEDKKVVDFQLVDGSQQIVSARSRKSLPDLTMGSVLFS